MALLTRLFAMALLILAAPAAAEWRRAESPNFIVYSEGSESRLRERIELLEDFDRLLRTITSVTAPPAPNKLHVYIFDGREPLQLIRPIPDRTGGFYAGTAHGIAAFVDGDSEGSGNETLFHEYAHHFMLHYAPNAYPAWYVEGFAEYLMTARFERRRIDIGNYSPGRVYAVTEGRWLPIDRVLFGRVDDFQGDARGMFYAQSWLLVHWFNSTPERLAGLRRYLVAARGADDPAQALQQATGLTPDQLHDELRRYIRGGSIRFRRMEREAGEAPPPVTVTSLPPAADDLMPYAAALRIGIAEPMREGHLAAIRAAAARHPEDPFAMRVLAHAEALHGEAAAADRLLERLMAGAPEDAELMYIKGMRHLTAAEATDAGEAWEAQTRQAREWFTRAHRADADHFPTLYRYAQSLRGERGFSSENTRNILLLAATLAPQVVEIRMNAAALLIAMGETEEAVALLTPLAADPHDSGLAQAAERMIREARSARRTTADEEAADPGAADDGVD